MTLQEVAFEVARRLGNIFLPQPDGHRPCHGRDERYADDPHWKDLVLFMSILTVIRVEVPVHHTRRAGQVWPHDVLNS